VRRKGCATDHQCLMRCGQNLEAWEPDDVREGDDIVEPANDTNEKGEEI